MNKLFGISKKKYPSAFTLIELLLVITIVFIAGTMSFYFLGTSKKENDLKTAEREVAATIKLTQSYALQGKTVSDGKTPCGFGFRFKDTKNYEIFYIPPGSGSDNCTSRNTMSAYLQYRDASSSPTFETFTLKNNIAFPNITSETEIYFTIPHANPFKSDGSVYSSYSLVLRSPGGKNKTIIISPSGSVLEE